MNDFLHALANIAAFFAVTGSLTLTVALITFLGNLGYKLAADALQIPSSWEESDLVPENRLPEQALGLAAAAPRNVRVEPLADAA